jgi:hypothetical protein
MLKGVDRAEDICDENYVIRGVLIRVHECTEALKIKSCLVSQDGEEWILLLILRYISEVFELINVIKDIVSNFLLPEVKQTLSEIVLEALRVVGKKSVLECLLKPVSTFYRD